MLTEMSWPIFKGTGKPAEKVSIPPPPQWRRFTPFTKAQDVPEMRVIPQGLASVDHPEVREMVSAAIALRRPLLVTGPPGCGKSILATLIAVELALGPLLRWPITSSSRLDKALYDYDAIGRVHEENRRPRDEHGNLIDNGDLADWRGGGIGRFIRLGPLGTALLPWTKPRVLLIDEIDKSDIDLPNELLDVFELGEFRVPELERLPEDRPAQVSEDHPAQDAQDAQDPTGERPVQVMTADSGRLAGIVGGVVRCSQFPVVVMTSNGERSFPPAFLRRCLRLRLEQPTGDQLAAIVRERIVQDQGSEDGDLLTQNNDLLKRFEDFLGQNKTLATDQLLNAVFIVSSRRLHGAERKKAFDTLVQDLDQVSP
jgi:MoxR-like ATPase